MPHQKPEFEIVDRVASSIRYLEHGWPNALCRWHAHQEFELHLITQTSGKVFIGDYIGLFQPGSLYMTGARLPHNWVTEIQDYSPVVLRDMLVQFDGTMFNNAQQIFPEFSYLNSMLSMGQSGIEFVDFPLEHAQDRMLSIRDSSGMSKLLNFMRFLSELSDWSNKIPLSLSRVHSDLSEESQDKVNVIVDYVMDNYRSEITLSAASKLVGMSESSFSRYFSHTTGSRFTEFVSRIRLGRAAQMLFETEEHISTICFASGFNNLANFNRQFLRNKGMTPSDFRKVAQKRL